VGAMDEIDYAGWKLWGTLIDGLIYHKHMCCENIGS